MAGKDPNGAWQVVGGDADVILVPEEGRQHDHSSRAHRAVGAWIRGIGCDDGERRPLRGRRPSQIPGAVGQGDDPTALHSVVL